MRKLIYNLFDRFFLLRVFFLYPQLKKVFEIHSHLTPPERYTLFKLANGRNRILEIGSYVGASAACFGASKKGDDSAKILCIDTWENDAMTEGKKNTYAEFISNTKLFSKWIIPIRGFSTDVVGKVSQHIDHLDLLFIDGDHSYEGVKKDWDTYKRFLTKGSVVVFHDCGWAEGVQKVIGEDAKPVMSSFVRLPNMWWGTIK